jgi:hypothetical protein
MINNAIEEKQIELVELLSNYNEILKFVKTKLSEEELDYYLDFFKKGIIHPPILKESDAVEGKIISM